jgi:hypothetical protein
MNRAYYQIRVWTTVAAGSLLAWQAAADPPDILQQYRFIPGHSLVQVTEGFAGVDWPLEIDGRFGLVTGYEYSVSPTAHVPTLTPFAKFTDVNAILFDPRRASPLPLPGWDLDQTLNLSGLDGTFTVPSELHFSGQDGQGQPIKLDAKISGRFLHLVGANDPGCCDFFRYKVDAFARLLPFADFNSDGVIDAADYTTWRDHQGIAAAATLEQGDADGDGDVDSDDFAAWLHDAGTTVDMSGLAALSGSGDVGGVPEPATMLLAASGFVWLAIRRLRSRAQL